MVRRIGYVVLFWLIAAMLVFGVHHAMDPISANGASLTKVLAIVASALAYVKLTARNVTVQHALLVGIAWLALDIVAEIVMTFRFGGGWFELIGPPQHELLRDVMLLAWVAAPALFARGESYEA
ncbi:MAG TPA: hypothetical protein VMU84_11405 [Thermoanaerobaculia bacterium]|nr:hypothetical protein [Thermoanaerobaculia bacterium]